jgi:hypothetical protein
MIPGDHRDLDVCTSAGSQGLSHVRSGRVLEPDQGEQGQPSLGFALRLAWAPCAFGHRQHRAAPLRKIITDIVRSRTQAPAENRLRRAKDNGTFGDDHRAEHAICSVGKSKLNGEFRRRAAANSQRP